jgi:3-oxoacyl-[acyl-carrier protein] reductase
MLLKDQVALITGSGRGIGKATALAFAKEGARVAVSGRTHESLDQVAAEIVVNGGEARSFVLDVTDDHQVASAVSDILSTWGRIDILVNNAGVVQYNTPVWAITIQQWDAMMGVNLRGVFLCCHAVLPHMRERGSGVIINIGSSSGRRASEEYGPYAATKWGVIGYTTSLARSARPEGVSVNGINPGWVDTDMTRVVHPDGDSDWSTPEEIAEVALFLAGKAPRDMTGQFIDVFGS